MIDQEILEQFIRAKILLQERLAEIGKIPGSTEIESQMMFLETRVVSRVKQDVIHGCQEMNALRNILSEISKEVAK